MESSWTAGWLYLLFVFCFLTSLKARAVHHMMPVDSHAFVTEWKGKPIDGKSMTPLLELLKLYFGFAAIVEQVREGTTLRVRLLMPDGEHQMVNIALAGVRSARASSKQGEPSEPYGEEVSSL
jgi:staphylococcal nuclease domain-containing protein 1